jgi:hypothetical protein
MSTTFRVTHHAVPVFPASLRCHSTFNWISCPALSPWRTCIALALARSSSAGAKRAHVALPVTPDRQGSSGHRRPHHHAQGKKARVHEAPVPSPPRHRDDDDYSPSDVDETTSGTKSDRLIPVLSLACFVWLFWVACWALGPGPLGSGPEAAGRSFRWPFGPWVLGLWARGLGPRAAFLSAGPVLSLGFSLARMTLVAATRVLPVFGGRRAPSCASSGLPCAMSIGIRWRRRCLTMRRTVTNDLVGNRLPQLSSVIGARPSPR